MSGTDDSKSDSILTVDVLLDALREIDPEWLGNPPEPGTREWETLTIEQRRRLIPRLLREIVCSDADANRLMDLYPPREPSPYIAVGVAISVQPWMREGQAVLLDRNRRVLAVLNPEEAR